MPNDKDILISIIIVNYKVPHFLIETLHSLRLAKYYDRSEVIIVDNASNDNSREIITSKFQEVRWIQQKVNIGFGKACNIGAEVARGQYLLLLNPDTIVSEGTLVGAVEFMEAHPSTGLMGPKILNPDGTLQLSCRRSIPTPSVAFYYFTGLSHLFPKSRRFGRYHLTYMAEDEIAQVDVISGSFMFMRSALFSTLGGFDKQFFMYGEDIDLCYRVSLTGHEVWYNPNIQIVHHKGKSSAKRRIRSRMHFYQAMVIFSRKYRGLQEVYFPWWLMWFGIMFQASFNIIATIARSATSLLIDLVMINCAFFAGQLLLSGGEQLPIYAERPLWSLIGIHVLVSFAFVILFLYNGIYSPRYYSVKNLVYSSVLSVALVLSGVYFLSEYHFAGFALALALIIPFTAIWRVALPKKVRMKAE